MMVSAIVREVLRRRKEREGVGDVCCYSFGLGQCSNAKYTKSLYNFLSDILFILNQSNVFCVLYSGCQGNNLPTTSVICAPTFLLITLRWPLFKGASYRAGEASLEKKCWQTVCWGQNLFVLRIIFFCDTYSVSAPDRISNNTGVGTAFLSRNSSWNYYHLSVCLTRVTIKIVDSLFRTIFILQ